MTDKEFAQVMEQLAPQQSACEWDNVGFIVNCKNDIQTILVSLDLTPEVFEEAKAEGADLIVTHHPIMFNKINKLDATKDSLIFKLIQNNISLFSAHTNMDKAENGINAALCKLLNMRDVATMDPEGISRMGTLEKPMSEVGLAQFIKEKLDIPWVRVSGSCDVIQQLAVCGGGGGQLIPLMQRCGAQAFLTGEVKYNNHVETNGLVLFECGHYETERVFIDVTFAGLQNALSALQYNICVLKTKADFTYKYY